MTKFIFKYCIYRIIAEAKGITHPAKDKVVELLQALLHEDPITVKKAANGLILLRVEATFYMIPCAIGLMHYLGAPVERNLRKAFAFFSIGNDLFHPQAKMHLASCYAFGLGTKKNNEQALELYKHLVSFDDFAQFEMGFKHEHGLSVKQDKQKALELYHQSAKLDNPFAQYRLWKLYIYKLYGIKNKTMLNKALTFLAKSTEQGHPEAQTDLFRYCFNNSLSYQHVLSNYALDLHEEGTESETDRQNITADESRIEIRGTGEDYYNYALFREHGYILDQDPSKALLFYAKAAAKNNLIAEAKLKAWENKPISEKEQREVEYLKYYS